jgi:hypothetical protein
MKEYILEKEHKPLGWAKVMTTIYYEEAKVEAGRRALKDNARYRVREIRDIVVYEYSATELKTYSPSTREALSNIFRRDPNEKFEWEDGCR